MQSLKYKGIIFYHTIQMLLFSGKFLQLINYYFEQAITYKGSINHLVIVINANRIF